MRKAKSIFQGKNEPVWVTGTTYPHEQPNWCCRLIGFPSLLFIPSLLHGLAVLPPTTIKKEVETSPFSGVETVNKYPTDDILTYLASNRT